MTGSLHSKLIAHRGFAGVFAENSMTAFRESLALGAGGIEIDVHQTADGRIVVMHDPRVDRTTNGSGWIEDQAWKSLKTLVLGGTESERIPLLEELLEMIGGKARLYIELKKGKTFYPGLEKRILGLIGNQRAGDWTFLHSFHNRILHTVSAIDPEVPLLLNRFGYGSFIKRPGLVTNLRKKLPGLVGLNLNHLMLSWSFIRHMHDMDMEIFAWTIKNPRQFRKVRDLGVDGIISNYPY